MEVRRQAEPGKFSPPSFVKIILFKPTIKTAGGRVSRTLGANRRPIRNAKQTRDQRVTMLKCGFPLFTFTTAKPEFSKISTLPRIFRNKVGGWGVCSGRGCCRGRVRGAQRAGGDQGSSPWRRRRGGEGAAASEQTPGAPRSRGGGGRRSSCCLREEGGSPLQTHRGTLNDSLT